MKRLLQLLGLTCRHAHISWVRCDAKRGQYVQCFDCCQDVPYSDIEFNIGEANAKRILTEQGSRIILPSLSVR